MDFQRVDDNSETRREDKSPLLKVVMHGPFIFCALFLRLGGASGVAKIIKNFNLERSASSLHLRNKMGSLFEQPRNAGTLCKISTKLSEVLKANMLQSSAARKSAVQILEIRMV
jgi:hypothetical protein